MAQRKIISHSYFFFWVLDVKDVGKVMALIWYVNSVGKFARTAVFANPTKTCQSLLAVKGGLSMLLKIKVPFQSK